MNKCVKCGHESNDEVTDVPVENQVPLRPGVYRVVHEWYCRKCRQHWITLDKPTKGAMRVAE
jgi:uncharacterized protein with PIN domain